MRVATFYELTASSGGVLAFLTGEDFRSFEEIRVLAYVEQLYEQHRHQLDEPLYVKVTDAVGKITEYEYWPESDEDVPSPLPNSTLTPPFVQLLLFKQPFVTARSILPSPLKSPPPRRWHHRHLRHSSPPPGRSRPRCPPSRSPHRSCSYCCYSHSRSPPPDRGSRDLRDSPTPRSFD